MNDNKMLRKKYRSQLIWLHALTVLFVAILEVVTYAFLIATDNQLFSYESKYLWKKVILPSSVNIAAHILARLAIKSEKLTHKQKNASIIYAALVTASVVALCHREYMVTLCAFNFPIFMSAMHNDRDLLKRTFLISMTAHLFSSFILCFETKLSEHFAIEQIIAYAFNIISYMAADIAVKFSQSSFSVIRNQASENEQLQDKLRRDRMTGLLDHATFYNELERTISSYSPHTHHFCLAVIDIDDFKNVNDTHGHDNGDIVLKNLAEILTKRCGKDDIVCRYGGEEFAVIFKSRYLSSAKITMHCILKEFEKSTYDFTESRITLSCGLCEYAESLTKEDFFEKADKALYRAKRNGKNQIVISE